MQKLGCLLVGILFAISGYSCSDDVVDPPCHINEDCHGDLLCDDGVCVTSICGNNSIEDGELCDGNCPTDCNDNDACTIDSLSGSADDCNAQCNNTDITSCIDDDGCCPAVCDNASDNDCEEPVPNCDDGIQNQEEEGVDCGGPCTEVCGTGATYYVSSTLGDDGNLGTSPDEAWATLAHASEQPLQPGDKLLFRRGDSWRDTFHLKFSGTADAWIEYGAYGPVNDPKPRILGSTQAMDWTELDTNIWQSSTALEDPYNPDNPYYYSAEVFFVENPGECEWGRGRTSQAELLQEYDWYYDGANILVYAQSNPETRYLAVEAPQRPNAIEFPNVGDYNVNDEDYVQYVAIDNLELMYLQHAGIYPGYEEIEAHGFKVTNSHIGCIGIKGDPAAYGIADWHSDALFQNNVIHDCGRRGISINTYSSGYTPDLVVSNVTIDNNLFYNGFHTTGPDISTTPDNGHTFIDFTISNNIVDDSRLTDVGDGLTSNSIYVESKSKIYQNFKIFNNIIIKSTARAIALVGIDGAYIYNNSIYGSNPNLQSHPGGHPYALVTLVNMQNVDFRNNIIHGNLPFINGDLEALCVQSTNASYSLRDYNLYYQDYSDQPFSGGHPNNNDPETSWYYNTDEWDAWKTLTSYDLSSPTPADPLFTDPENGDLSLQAGSPAISAGTPIPLVTTDKDGNLRDASTPDIGALEYLP